MTDEKLRELLSVGRETESLEVKPGLSRLDQIAAARVTRAALGMANHEGGGWVVVGVEEAADGTFVLTGVPPGDVSSWSHDDVSAMINGCAEPHIEVEVSHVTLESKNFVVIRIQEFVDIPVVCRRQGPTPLNDRQVYRKDTCYARSRRKPETVEAASDSTTWRTLMELAGFKAVKRFGRLASQVAGEATPTDGERYKSQIADLA